MNPEKHLLDTNIVSRICFPKTPANKELALWFCNFLSKPHIELYLAEIVSYEVRRGLWVKKLKGSNAKGLERFEAFSKHFIYLPINSEVFKIAEELWANARVNGYPTASNDSLDADVLLAAQAILVGASVITENTKHLKQYVKTYHWNELCVTAI